MAKNIFRRQPSRSRLQVGRLVEWRSGDARAAIANSFFEAPPPAGDAVVGAASADRAPVRAASQRRAYSLIAAGTALVMLTGASAPEIPPGQASFGPTPLGPRYAAQHDTLPPDAPATPLPPGAAETGRGAAVARLLTGWTFDVIREVAPTAPVGSQETARPPVVRRPVRAWASDAFRDGIPPGAGLTAAPPARVRAQRATGWTADGIRDAVVESLPPGTPAATSAPPLRQAYVVPQSAIEPSDGGSAPPDTSLPVGLTGGTDRPARRAWVAPRPGTFFYVLDVEPLPVGGASTDRPLSQRTPAPASPGTRADRLLDADVVSPPPFTDTTQARPPRQRAATYGLPPHNLLPLDTAPPEPLPPGTPAATDAPPARSAYYVPHSSAEPADGGTPPPPDTEIPIGATGGTQPPPRPAYRHRPAAAFWYVLEPEAMPVGGRGFSRPSPKPAPVRAAAHRADRLLETAAPPPFAAPAPAPPPRRDVRVARETWTLRASRLLDAPPLPPGGAATTRPVEPARVQRQHPADSWTTTALLLPPGIAPVETGNLWDTVSSTPGASPIDTPTAGAGASPFDTPTPASGGASPFDTPTPATGGATSPIDAASPPTPGARSPWDTA